MLKNYLRIGIRSIWKRKTYSLVNVIGLAVGIASFILILLYVSDERAFDGFHEKADHLYRINTFETDDGLVRHTGGSYYPVADAMSTSLPEGSKLCRFLPQSVSIKNPGTNETVQEQSFYFADSTFFDLFSFSALTGNPNEALQVKNQLVLTETAAKRYFGDADPVGSPLVLENKADFVVGAVVKDPPTNSTIQFEFIAPIASVDQVIREEFFHPRGAWYFPMLYTFAYVPDEAYIADWENYSPTWEEQSMAPHLVEQYDFHFQPIQQLHFQALESDLGVAVRPSFLWILMGIAFLILGVASINYINLSLTQMIKRYPEIGVRKVLGAVNGNIFSQISMEAVLVILISLIAGLGLVSFTLPYFNQLTGKALHLFEGSSFQLWALVFAALVVIACVISIFPYYGLTRYNIIGILKGKMEGKTTSRKKFSLKSGLVVFQFVTAIGLIIATLVIQYQLNFIQNKDMGFSADQLLVVPIRDEAVQEDYVNIKENLLAQTGVKGITAISNFPWETGFYDFNTTISNDGKNRELNTPTLLVDEDFSETMELEIIEGRSFSKDQRTDQQRAFLINEAALEQFEISDFEQAGVKMSGLHSGDNIPGRLIGVVKDFHFKSLHNPIDPLMLTVVPQSYFLDNFVIKVSAKNLPGTMANLSNTWAKLVPNRPFDYFFLDEAFNRLYLKESRMGKIFQSFTILALFIAFLGLLALSALSAEQRTKEIGIRKVLGASVSSIVGLLSRDYLRLVILSLLIAGPIAWYAMRGWLANFAYHVEIRWWIFLLAGMSAVLVALASVSLQSMRAAFSNPIDSLRDE